MKNSQIETIQNEQLQQLTNCFQSKCNIDRIPLNKRLMYLLMELNLNNEYISIYFNGRTALNFNFKIDDKYLKILCDILLPHATKIQHIDLSFNRITHIGMIYLAELIAKTENLISINLQYNDLGIEGGQILLNTLVDLKKVDKLKLVYLNIEGCKIQVDGLLEINFEKKLYEGEQTLIEKFLNNNLAIEEINLGENEIEETGLIELFSMLNPNINLTNLKVLCLDAPFKLLFTEETAYQLSQIIKTNNCLEKLSLRKCGLKDECLTTIIKEALENDNLRVLDFSANCITYQGCKLLAKFLESQFCSLQSLILNNNQIRDNGVAILKQALIKNQTLVHLNMNFNGLQDQGLYDLGEVMKKNQCLVSLYTFWNQFGEKSLQIFYELIYQNKKNFFFDFMLEKNDNKEISIFQNEEVLPENIYAIKKHYIKINQFQQNILIVFDLIQTIQFYQ